jgi:hypothetical protein
VGVKNVGTTVTGVGTIVGVVSMTVGSTELQPQNRTILIKRSITITLFIHACSVLQTQYLKNDLRAHYNVKHHVPQFWVPEAHRFYL